jgi:hypothetical protein
MPKEVRLIVDSKMNPIEQKIQMIKEAHEVTPPIKMSEGCKHYIAALQKAAAEQTKASLA